MLKNGSEFEEAARARVIYRERSRVLRAEEPQMAAEGRNGFVGADERK
jgi:hypothetical protein